jgi:Tfp pilus assembly protein PilN
MTPFLLATAAAPAISLSSATAITALLAIIAALLGFALWFLQREIKNNDAAHQELKREITDTRRELKADIKAVEADVKQLLTGQSRIEGLLEGMVRQPGLTDTSER